MIKRMGANNTEKAITNASRAAAGQQKVIENFDTQKNRAAALASFHSHKSAAADESKVQLDLRILKPFNTQPDSFPVLSSDPLPTLDEVELDRWLNRHKTNLMLDAPMEHDDNDDDGRD